MIKAALTGWQVLATILIAALCPLLALMLCLSPPLTPLVAAFTVQPASDFSREYLVQTAVALRDFCLGNDLAPLPTGSDYQIAITNDALAHLLDVRGVFIGLEVATTLATLLLVLSLVVLLKFGGLRVLSKPLLIGAAIPLAIALLLAAAIWIDFSGFFAALHSLFFAAGSWVFPADSLLIRALPQAFWLSCALIWAGAMALLCVSCLLLGIGVLSRATCRKQGLNLEKGQSTYP